MKTKEFIWKCGSYLNELWKKELRIEFVKKIPLFHLFKRTSRWELLWTEIIRYETWFVCSFSLIFCKHYIAFPSPLFTMKEIEGICLIFLFNEIEKTEIAIGIHIRLYRFIYLYIWQILCDNGKIEKNDTENMIGDFIISYIVHCKIECFQWISTLSFYFFFQVKSNYYAKLLF